MLFIVQLVLHPAEADLQPELFHHGPHAFLLSSHDHLAPPGILAVTLVDTQPIARIFYPTAEVVTLCGRNVG